MGDAMQANRNVHETNKQLNFGEFHDGFVWAPNNRWEDVMKI